MQRNCASSWTGSASSIRSPSDCPLPCPLHARIPMKLTAALLTVVALAATSAAQAQQCKYNVPDSQLVKKGALVMSVNPTLPPVQYVDQQGNLRGMRVELGEEIAKRLCLKP